MKNKKWLWWTLTILVTLLVLTGVGGAAYRMGVMQGAQLTQNADGTGVPFAFQMRGHDDNFQGGMDRQHSFGFDHGRNFESRRGGFIMPLFGLLRFAVLGLLVWGGYTLARKSGWKLVKETTSVAASVPVVEEQKAQE